MKILNNRGFTLLELLVVIAIIGIMSAIVMAVLSSQRAKAQAIAIRATMRSLQGAIAMCDNDKIPTMIPSGAGGLVCSTQISKMPTLAQLGSGVTGTWTSVGSDGRQLLTITVASHPNSDCNGLWAVDSASTTLAGGVPSATCK